MQHCANPAGSVDITSVQSPMRYSFTTLSSYITTCTTVLKQASTTTTNIERDLLNLTVLHRNATLASATSPWELVPSGRLLARGSVYGAKWPYL